MNGLPEEKIFTMEDIENLSEGQRGELIDGRFYNISSPSWFHQALSMALSATIFNHIGQNKGKCRVYTAPYAVYPFKNDKTYVEPDISVICDPDKLGDQGCSGAPDWIIEIVSVSSVEHDYYRKYMIYRAAGVKEYWVVNPEDSTVIVHTFPVTTPYTFDDDIPVSIYPGFSIRISNLI